MKFLKFDTFIFDLDGCIWIYPKVIDGVEKIINKLKKLGKQLLIVSNFSVLSRKETIKILRKEGIDINLNEILTSSYVIAQFLRNQNYRVMAFGDGIIKELRDNKIKLTKKLPVDFLVVGHDLKFNYKKLSLSYKAIMNGAKLIFPSYGDLWPTRDGMLPGTGAIIKPIQLITKKKGILFGKPSRFMAEFLDMFVYSRNDRVVLFGDELNSDIKFGNALGYFTVLVKSGVDKKVKRKIKPDLILNSVVDIKL